MILLGLFKFIGFMSGVIITLLVVGMFLRARSDREQEEESSKPRKTPDQARALQVENSKLKSQTAQLESEINRQQAELQEIRRQLDSLKSRRGQP